MDLFNIFQYHYLWDEAIREERRRTAQRLAITRKMLRVNFNALDWQDELFEQHFRVTKPIFVMLCEELKSIRGKIYETRRAIPLEHKLLITLAFFGTGSYQRITGSSNNVSQQTVSNCVHEITNLMNQPVFLNKWIKFSTTRHERERVKQQFYEKFKLPGIWGVIDGTHVAIVRPVIRESLYFNRKGYHSLNVMIICDSGTKITAVNAKFGGACHDSHVWKMSAVRNYIEGINNAGEPGWLIGDTGYPLRPWMMRPFEGAVERTREYRYNAKHATARCTIERCIGILKSIWRCLLKHRVLHYDPEFSGKIVNACCALHNILYDYNAPQMTTCTYNVNDLGFIPVPAGNIEHESLGGLEEGCAIRQRLVNEFC